MIKFPTDYGAGELREDQVAAHECYTAMMEMDDHLQAMNISTTPTLIEQLGLVPSPARWSAKRS